MVVAYEELADSPMINMDRHGGSATRKAKIDWEDIEAFFLELLPNPYNGYTNATFPGIPWLIPEKISVEPFDNKPSGQCEAINTFPNGALVTVDYAPPDLDHGMQAGPRGVTSGPGGVAGSAGGQKGQDQTFVTHSVDYGGEFITYPNKHWRWQYSATGVNDGNPINYVVNGDPTTGVLQPLIEHTISWHQVFWPPWQSIRLASGRVNVYKFAGCPVGTLLFLGCSASRELTNLGVRGWKMEYKFTEKNYNTSNPNKPRGWNYFLRPNGVRAGQFELLLRKPQRKRIIVDGDPLWVLPACLTDSGINGATVAITLDENHVRLPDEAPFRIKVSDPATGKFEIMDVLTKNAENITVLRAANGGPRRNFGGGARVIMTYGMAYDTFDFKKLFAPGMPVV